MNTRISPSKYAVMKSNENENFAMRILINVSFTLNVSQFENVSQIGLEIINKINLKKKTSKTFKNLQTIWILKIVGFAIRKGKRRKMA